MKRLQKKTTLAIVAALCFTFIFSLFYSCEIGLGSAVDVEPPSLTIDSPDVDSVIRDVFAVKGRWSDDGSVSKIQVTLTRTDGYGKPVTVDGEWVVDELLKGTGVWTAVVDYKKENLLDGTYQIVASIKDKSNHETTQNTTVTLDNTAPILILNKPNSAPGETPSVYGQRLYLQGNIADTAKQTFIKVEFYRDEACTDLIHSVKTDPISPTDVNSNNAKLATFLDVNYDTIYGTAGLDSQDITGRKQGSKSVYTKFKIYDNAERFPVDEEQTAEDHEGNCTEIIYFSKDLSDSITKRKGADGGFGLAPIDIYTVVNGTESLKDNANRNISDSEITSILDILKTKEQTISYITINPDNNPYFTISGLNTLLHNGSEFDDQENGYQIKNGSQILEISVFMGNDAIELATSNTEHPFYAYLLECDRNGIPSKEDKEENRIKLYSKVKDVEINQNGKTEKMAVYTIGGKQGHKTTDGAYVFNVPVSKNIKTWSEADGEIQTIEMPLVYGTNYLIRVNGVDNEGNAIVPNGTGYGFKFMSNDSAPTLKITEPEKPQVYKKLASEFEINGTVKSMEGVPTVEIFLDDVSLGFAHFETTNDGETNEFNYTITSDKFDQVTSKQYLVRVTATRGTAPVSVEKTIYYDVEGPEITIISEDPVIEKDLDNDGQNEKYINGILKIKGSVSDEFDRFGDAYYTVMQGDTVLIPKSNSTKLNERFEFEINTLDSIFTNDTDIQVVITATDRAGNETTNTLEYHIDQETDRPQITNNASGVNLSADLANVINGTWNMFTKTSTLYLNIDDDDGLVKKTTVTLYEYDIDNETEGAVIDTKPFLEQSAAPYQFPDKTGIFKVKVLSEDNNYVSATQTKYNFSQIEFFVRLTGNGPDVTIDPPSTYVSTNGKDGVLELTFNIVNEGNGPYSLDIATDNPLNPLHIYGTEGTQGPKQDSGFTYTKTYAAGTNLTSDTIKFIIKDNSGVKTEKEYKVKFDNTVPEIKFSAGGWPTRNGETDNDTFYFKGTVKDEAKNGETDASGVSGVKIIFKDGECKNGQGVVQVPADDDAGWITVTSTPSTWNYLATWKELKPVFWTETQNENEESAPVEGIKTVFVKAIDNAENHSECVAETFIYDISAPEISSVEGPSYTNTDSITLTIKVKDTNSIKPAVVLYMGDVQETHKQAESLVTVSNGTGPDSEGLFTYTATVTFPTVEATASEPAHIPDETYNITVTGKDNNGRTGNTSIFRTVRDTQLPNINNVALSEGTEASENPGTYIYKDSYYSSEKEKYFTNNISKRYKVSGVSTDNIGLESVVLKVQKGETFNAQTDLTPGITGDTGVWEFNDINLTSWTSGAKAIITVTDVAGNTKDYSLSIVFDITPPEGVSEIDSSSKNLYFRIGSNNNDDNENVTAAGAVGKWDEDLDTDVGGKYGHGTFGNATTIQIRGNFTDGENSSGVSKIYYKVFTQEQLYTTDEALEELKNSVINNYTGIITPLKNPETKRVFYNVGPKLDANGDPVSPEEPDPDKIFGGTKFADKNDKGYYKYFKNVVSNFKDTVTGFTPGNNFLMLVAVDNAGNSAVDSALVNFEGEETKFINYSLNVDIVPPSEITTKSHTGILYTNKAEPTVIWGTVSDKSSVVDSDGNVIAAGIKSFVLSRDGIAETVKAKLRAVRTQDDTSETPALPKDSDELIALAENDSTLKIWEADVSSLLSETDATVSISATATDAAGTGNTTPGVVATITVDTDAPEVSIVTDSSLDADTSDEIIQVNGTINLSGTAEDENGLDKLVSVYYKVYTGDTVPDAPQANSNVSEAGWKTVSYTEKKGTSNWKFTGIDTTTMEGTTLDGSNTKVCFTVAVKDKAGNIGYSSPLPVVVNQDTDRPVITISNPSNLTALAGGGSVTWEMSEISGTLTDDDIITYFGYCKGDSISYEAAAYTEITRSNGIWKIPGLHDGTNKIFFKVTAGGKDYYANTSLTYSEKTIFDTTKNRGTYKLTDGNNKFGYHPETGNATTTNILSLIIDTVAPDVETAEYSIDGNTWQTGIGTVTFGGTRNNKLRIRQGAWDKNTVKSMTVKVIETINGVDKEEPLFEETYSTLTTPPYVPTPVVKENGNEYLIFSSTEIDLTNWLSTYKNSNTDSNAKCVEITMSDGIKSTVTKLELTVDNTAPVITFNGPERGSTNSGEVTVYGTTNERGTIYYTVSTDGTHAPGTTEGEVISSWTGYTVSPDGSTITPKNNGTITGENGATSVAVPEYQIIPDSNISWYVYFDDNTSDTQRAHANYLKNYARQLGLTTNLNSFTDLVNFYIWIKIEDSVGNTAEYPYPVCVDPQGDRPAVTLSNPEKAGDSLGGTVKLFGFAEDSNGTVQNVWLQLLSAKNGTGYGTVNKDDSNQITSFEPTETDIEFWLAQDYSVYFIDGGEEPVELKLSSNTQNTSATVFNSAEHNPVHCYIKANFSGSSWNLKINTHQEFDPEGTSTPANDMAVRVYARDNDRNLSYPVTRYFKMDKDTPVITNVMLKQYAASDTSFENPLASQEVRPGMYVKGKWYLEFTAKDNSGISGVAFTDSNNNDETIPDSNITKPSDNEWNVRFLLNTDSSGVGSFIRTIKATDNSNPIHTGTYQIEINYDNEAPKLLKDSSSDFNISEDVKQSNGFYKLYSKVSDATNSVTGTPSGIKAVGFYFMRRIASDEGLIYDPLQKRVNPLSTNDLVYEDGLYWMSGSVSCQESGAILLENGLVNRAAYIHTGSYIKLGGVMYKITSSDGTFVTIAENHDNSYTEAKIALAQFVDNRKSEYEASSDKNSETGYYNSIKNDDGDSMVEELGGTNIVSSWQGLIVSRNIPDGPIEVHYTAYDESMNYALGIVGNKSLDTYKTYETDEAIEFKNLGSALQDGQYSSYVYTYKESSPAYISNNGPRLTAVTVAIDYSGTGELEHAKKYTSYYKREKILIDGEAVDKNIAVTKDILVANEIITNDVVTGYKGFVTLKGKTWIIPEMVGGNGKLWYDYKIYDSNDNGIKTGDPVAASTTAAYLDEGEDDFDTYLKSIGGQTYVEEHEKLPILHEESFLEELETSTIEKPTWFDYTIYDSTEGESNLENNQKATISIALAVKVKDETAPNVVINPFYWKSADENSLYNNSTANGHIELEDDWMETTAYTTNAAKAEAEQDSELDGDPKVSGKIVISGYAYDNRRLKDLKVSITNSTVLSSETIVAVYENNSWHDSTTTEEEVIERLSKGSINNDGWEFKVYYEPAPGEDENVVYSGEKGHKVKWTLAFDTSKVTGVAAKDVTVKVVAVDGKDNTSEEDAKRATTGTTDETYHKPAYKMDVVPYIVKVYTSLAKLKSNNWSVYNRTALGHYPVAADKTKEFYEDSIYFYGFNFGKINEGNELTEQTFPKYNEDTLGLLKSGAIETGECPFGIEYASYMVAKLPIMYITTSGKISIFVNDVESLNNLNNNESRGAYTESVNLNEKPTGDYTVYKNYYNRLPNDDNNNLLTDDVEVDVWEVDPEAVKPKVGVATQPVMDINPVNGQIGFAFAGNGIYFNMPYGTNPHKTNGKNNDAQFGYGVEENSYHYWIGGNDFWNSIEFTYDSEGYSYGVVAGGDINGAGEGKADIFRFTTSRWGRGKRNTDGYDDLTNQLGFELIGQQDFYKSGDSYVAYGNFNKERIRSTTLTTAPNDSGTSVYLAYYDAINNEIRFKWGIVNNTYENESGLFKKQYKTGNNRVLSGKTYTLTNNSLIAGQTTEKVIKTDGTMYNTDGNTSVIADGNIPVNAGQFVSIVALPGQGTSDDAVVAVWLDGVSKNLVYSYNLKPKSISSGKFAPTDTKWSTPVKIFKENVGDYCKVIADKNNGIHIAAYDSLNGDLWYAYVNDFQNPRAAKKGIVDSSGFVGNELNIDVAIENGNPIPYISYYALSASRPKMAKWISSTSLMAASSVEGAINEEFTNKWEISYIPTSSKVSIDHVNVGVWKNQNGELTYSTTDGEIPNGLAPGVEGSNLGKKVCNVINGHITESNGKIYGNGTKNPVLGYAITQGASGFIETAQMK